jgi:hypothetical protein
MEAPSWGFALALAVTMDTPDKDGGQWRSFKTLVYTMGRRLVRDVYGCHKSWSLVVVDEGIAKKPQKPKTQKWRNLLDAGEKVGIPLCTLKRVTIRTGANGSRNEWCGDEPGSGL